MAFMQQALQLVGFEEDFQMVQPWWDVLSECAVDFAVMLALTSVTTDLFEGTEVKQQLQYDSPSHVDEFHDYQN